MLKRIAPILLALLIAIVVGIYSADQMTRSFSGFGSLRYGAWVSHPQAGTPDADPYAKAYAARTGNIALGSAEGLVFIAPHDDKGETLNASCDYIIEGKTPAARAWTLRVTDENLLPIFSKNGKLNGLHSGNTLRNANGGFKISISSIITEGNWIPQSGNGERRFVLTLYDTSVASTTGVSEIKMPAIRKIGCDNE